MKAKMWLLGLVLISLLIIPQIAMAQGAIEPDEDVTSSDLYTKMSGQIQNILSIVFYIAGGIAVLLLIVVGIMYMQASDPVEKKKQADRLKTIIIGLIIIVLATAIVNFIWAG